MADDVATETAGAIPERGANGIDALVRDAAAARRRGPFADVAAFVRAVAVESESTVADAVRGGARADRLGYAFVAGYHAALRGLDLEGPGGRSACVAATEVAGVHPRAIETTLSAAGRDFTLRGQKTFVTLASESDDLLVIARREEPDARGRKQLVAVRIPRGRAGVRVENRPATSFAPEVPHARVLLEDVEVAADEVLAGDGWDDWLRPFRTVEDVHVLAAAAGHLLAVAREAGQVEFVAAELAAVIAIALGVEREGWTAPGGHLALEGALRLSRNVYERLLPLLPAAMDAERRRLERDQPLLAVAEAARQKRLAVAVDRVAPRE